MHNEIILIIFEINKFKVVKQILYYLMQKIVTVANNKNTQFAKFVIKFKTGLCIKIWQVYRAGSLKKTVYLMPRALEQPIVILALAVPKWSLKKWLFDFENNINKTIFWIF